MLYSYLFRTTRRWFACKTKCSSHSTTSSSSFIDDKEYFRLLLNQPPSYFINKQHLQSNFYELQKIVHPDKHGNESSSIIGDMLAFSAEINDAYATLKDDRLRVKYLCKLHGYGYDEKVVAPAHISVKQLEWLETSDGDEFLREQCAIECLRLIEQYNDKMLDCLRVNDEEIDWKQVSQHAQALVVLEKSLQFLRNN